MKTYNSRTGSFVAREDFVSKRGASESPSRGFQGTEEECQESWRKDKNRRALRKAYKPKHSFEEE